MVIMTIDMHVDEQTPSWDGLEWDTCSIIFLQQGTEIKQRPATAVEYKLLVVYIHKTCNGINSFFFIDLFFLLFTECGVQLGGQHIFTWGNQMKSFNTC